MIAKGSQSPINRDDLAADYRRVVKMIKNERAMRVRVELAAQARVEQPMLFELGDGGSARVDY